MCEWGLPLCDVDLASHRRQRAQQSWLRVRSLSKERGFCVGTPSLTICSGPHPCAFPCSHEKGCSGKRQPGSRSGSLEARSKGAFLGPAVPASSVGSWLKGTAGLGSRRGGRLGAEGNSKVSCLGGAVGWHSGQRTLQLCSVPHLTRLEQCSHEYRLLETHWARS